MNAFINEVNLERIALFKAELIYYIVSEMDLNDNMRSRVIEEIISCLGDALML